MNCLFFLLFVADRATKYCAELYLPNAAGSEVIFPSLATYHNRGISFSLLRNYPSVSLAMAITATAALGIVCLRTKAARSMAGIVFLFAGALGNLTDRLLYGHVIDWIYVGGHINLADIWLCVGGLLVLAESVKIYRRSLQL